MVRKVIMSGKYVDYFDEIQASHQLGYPANWISSDNNSSIYVIFTYEIRVFCLGYHSTVVHEIGPTAITKKNYLAYWKEFRSGDNATAIKGDRGLQGKRGATCDRGEAGPEGSIGQRGHHVADGRKR